MIYSNPYAGYWDVAARVMKEGISSEPRDMKVFELLGTNLHVKNTGNADFLWLPPTRRKNISKRIAAMEALQLIAGKDFSHMLPPVFDKFKEPDGTFHGNYGARVGPTGLTQIADTITRDPDTRQAVLTLFDQERDLGPHVPPKRDYPCTLSIQFLLRDSRVHMVVTMRSNDVWLGMPYDTFQFSQLQLTLCRMLGQRMNQEIRPGQYVHNVGSLHIYQSNFGSVEKMLAEGDVDRDPKPAKYVYPMGLRDPAIARGLLTKSYTPMSDSEYWYAEAIA